MESNSTPTNTKYRQVVVDVPEDRIAEFHAFFARFLAGRTGPGHRGRPGRPHRRHHGRHCGEHRDVAEHSEAAGRPAGTAEV
jgi:hypothetical protein